MKYLLISLGLAVLLAMPAAGQSSKSKQTGAGGFLPEGWVSVKDYGAACDLTPGKVGPTDDTAAVQAAIDAVAGSNRTLKGVYFPPTPCYVTDTITLSRYVDLDGLTTRTGGLACDLDAFSGTGGDCLVPTSDGGDGVMQYTQIRNLGIYNVLECTEGGAGDKCVFGGSGCTCTGTYPGTTGSGINFGGDENAQPGEMTKIENVAIGGFPEFGILFGKGLGPGYVEHANIQNNGHAPVETGDDGIVDSATSTTLVDTDAGWDATAAAPAWCGACTGTGEHAGKYVTITGGTGVGQIRVIRENTADTLTVDAWLTDPVATDTYEITFGGGIFVNGRVGSDQAGMLSEISGDANGMGLIVIGEGSGGAGSHQIAMHGIKSETGSDATEQRCGINIINHTGALTINGLHHTGSGVAESAAICIASRQTNHISLKYSGVNIHHSDNPADYYIDARWLDTAADRFAIGVTGNPSVTETLESNSGDFGGSGPNYSKAFPVTEDPIPCVANYSGYTYYNSTDNEICFCNGTAWVQVDGGVCS